MAEEKGLLGILADVNILQESIDQIVRDYAKCPHKNTTDGPCKTCQVLQSLPDEKQCSICGADDHNQWTCKTPICAACGKRNVPIRHIGFEHRFFATYEDYLRMETNLDTYLDRRNYCQTCQAKQIMKCAACKQIKPRNQLRACGRCCSWRESYDMYGGLRLDVGCASDTCFKKELCESCHAGVKDRFSQVCQKCGTVYFTEKLYLGGWHKCPTHLCGACRPPKKPIEVAKKPKFVKQSKIEKRNRRQARLAAKSERERSAETMIPVKGLDED